MSKREKKVLEKKSNWINSFMLIGEAKINDYTYKIDEKSEKSDWIYNVLNLGVYCGERYGTVYSELMGGYGSERDNIIYVHGKDKDGKDDFENRFTVDWKDRFDSDILESVGNRCFLTVGIEKDKSEKVYYKKFLTPYDMIAYVKENLTDGMIINVRGNLKYSIYNNVTQVKKEINSIVLSKDKDENKYKAVFNQTMLLTKDSVGKVNKDTGILPVHAKVLDYVKEYNGKEVRTNIPYNKTFEYELDLSKPERVKEIISKVFKVQRGVTEITFIGDLIEGGAMVTVTEDDIPDDIKELIDMEIYTLEEALEKCTVNSGYEKRMVLRKPIIKMVESKNGNTIPVLQKFEKKYEEEDLILDFMIEKEDDTINDVEIEDAEIEEIINDEVIIDDDNSWLNNL